jgi:hypothetical protein
MKSYTTLNKLVFDQEVQHRFFSALDRLINELKSAGCTQTALSYAYVRSQLRTELDALTG